MTIIFTDEEKKYLITDLFNWHIAEGCPDNIRKNLEKKLSDSELLPNEEKEKRTKEK